MKRTNITFIVIFLLALAIRLMWVFCTDNAGYGDAAARLHITMVWLYTSCKTPSVSYMYILNPSLDWLPLHFYLMGLVSYITHDLIYAPRLFTALISALTLIPLYKICLVRYDRITANIALAILAFYGMHIYISGLILSESFYIFFLLWCYYFIERYRTGDKDTKWVVLIGLCLFACCLLRYEGWVFAPLVIVLVPFIKKIRLKNFLLLLLVPSIAVCFIMICEVIAGQHPLRGILYSDYEVGLSNHFHGAIDYSTLFPAYLPAYFISALLLFREVLRTKKRPEILMFALYMLPILPFVVKLCDSTVTTQGRYLVVYMAPGIVLIAHFIFRICQKLKLRDMTLILIVIGYITVSNISFAKNVENKRLRLKYDRGLIHSARYFRDSIPRAIAYVDYGFDLSNCNWMVYADQYEIELDKSFNDSVCKANHINIDSVCKTNNLFVETFWRRLPKNVRYRVGGRESEWKTWSSSNFDNLLVKKNITHIVLFPGGMLSDYLHFSKPEEIYLNKKFTRLFNEDGYMIYKIE